MPAEQRLSETWTGTVAAPAPPAPPFIIPVPLFYTLVGTLGTMGGVAVYIHWFRRIRPAIPLERLRSAFPAITLPDLSRVMPAVPLANLPPAPITPAPAVPRGPFRPISIPRRPIPIRPIRFESVEMTPSEMLERLKQIAAPPRSKILVEELKAGRLGMKARLERLKRVTEPSGPPISLEKLAMMTKPTAPEIQPKRPEPLAGLVRAGAVSKRLRKRKPAAEAEALGGKWPEGVAEILEQLRRGVYERTARRKRK
jgi:hypothetical protein